MLLTVGWRAYIQPGHDECRILALPCLFWSPWTTATPLTILTDQPLKVIYNSIACSTSSILPTVTDLILKANIFEINICLPPATIVCPTYELWRGNTVTDSDKWREFGSEMSTVVALAMGTYNHPIPNLYHPSSHIGEHGHHWHLVGW